jgi:predicted RNA-binding protein YlxR (DUF448 family)
MKRKHVPARRCVICKQILPQMELMRYKLSPETGELVADTDKFRIGRGWYACLAPDCQKNILRYRIRRNRQLKSFHNSL